MYRHDFPIVFDRLTPPLMSFFARKLSEQGHRGPKKEVVRQLVQQTAEAAYRNCCKDSLSGYSTRRLVWLKAWNVLYAHIHPPKKMGMIEASDEVDSLEDTSPDPARRLILHEKLNGIRTVLSDEEVEIFIRLAEKASYQELAEEYHSTGPAMKQRVYRLRGLIRKQFPDYRYL